MHILDGRPIAKEIYASLSEFSGILPKVAIIYSTDDPSAIAYMKVKLRNMRKYGIQARTVHVPNDASTKTFVELIRELNEDEDVDGIFVELPLPKHVDHYEVVSKICPLKDIEGLSPWNLGNLFYMKEFSPPSTAEAVIKLLEYYNVDVHGKDVVIMGKGIATARPLALMLMNRGATVQVIHKASKQKQSKTKLADILIVSIGKPKFVGREFVKEGAIVIDIGTNYTKEGLVGDVDAQSLKDVVHALTPVPGGIGPITTAITIRRCFELKAKRMKLEHGKI